MIEILLNEIGVVAELPDGIPGPAAVTAGDSNNGYFGVVPSREFINTSKLSALTGIGGVTKLANPDWIKVAYKGRTVFYPVQCIKDTITYEQLAKAGCVYGGMNIRIRGHLYRVRLVQSTVTNPYTQGASTAPTQMKDSEWSHSVLRMCDVTTNADGGSKYASFTAAQLGLNAGVSTITQSDSSGGSNVMGVGGASPAAVVLIPKTSFGSNYGWRPFIELVDDYPVIANSGPGPKNLIQYDSVSNTGYFGLVNKTDLFTAEQIEAVAVAGLGGTQANRDIEDLWFKFYYKGKILYYARKSLVLNTTWNTVYAAGLIYGTDDNGKYPDSGKPTVNQYHTLTRTDETGKSYTFKVRVPSGCTTDPANTGAVDTMKQSEYSQLFERMYPTNGIDLVWGNYGNPGGNLLLIESRPTYLTYMLLCNGNNSAYMRGYGVKDTTTTMSWLPVLEIVP